jgi:DNA repair exonuclease SbcCD ATPase subunit
VEGKKAVIIDFVNNVQKHGLPTQTHNWSLTQSVEKRKQFNEDGTLSIRQCENCFRCFQGNRCPYCGKEHIPKGRELAQMKDVELKRIEEIHKEEQEQKRRAARREQGECKSYEELYALAVKRGYKTPAGWAYFIMKGRK